MSGWVEGHPREPGVYWIRSEDQSGYAGAYIIQVEHRTDGAKEPLPKVSPNGDLLEVMRLQQEWHDRYMRLMWAVPGGDWQEMNALWWRETHHMRVVAPSVSLQE